MSGTKVVQYDVLSQDSRSIHVKITDLAISIINDDSHYPTARSKIARELVSRT